MGYWIVDDEDRYDDIDDLCERLFDSDYYYDNCDEDQLNEWIDECYDSVEIAGCTFYASAILRELDDYMYNELKNDWAHSQAESDSDYWYSTLNNMSHEDYEDINGYRIEYFEEEDEEEDEDNEEVAEQWPWDSEPTRPAEPDPFYADEEKLDDEEEVIIKTLMDHFQMVS